VFEKVRESGLARRFVLGAHVIPHRDTEIFVMDNKGLNVGQSDITSDYWQGDEAKWQKTYSVGASAIHISDVAKDESTQSFQSQLSLPVVDPANNQVIGAVTIGINVEQIAH
jgi:hypothetical protein